MPEKIEGTCRACGKNFSYPVTRLGLQHPRKYCKECVPVGNGPLQARAWKAANPDKQETYKLIRRVGVPPDVFAAVECLGVVDRLTEAISRWEQAREKEAPPALYMLREYALSLAGDENQVAKVLSSVPARAAVNELVCQVCEKTFMAATPKAKYCSVNCRNKAYRMAHPEAQREKYRRYYRRRRERDPLWRR